MPLRSRSTALLLTLSLGTALGSIHAQNTTDQPDKYQWLEDVNGERSMAWVNAENARSAKVLQADPHYDALAETALKVLESPPACPVPGFRVGTIYNTWQDAQHVRGILRRTTLESYITDKPDWHTVIDYDALASRTTRSGLLTASTASTPVTASASSLSPPAVKTPTPSASSTSDRKVRRRRLRPPALQAERSLGRQRHPPRRPQLGSRHHDPVRIPLRRQTLEARHSARPGQRGLSRYTLRRQRRPRGPP